MNLEKRRSFAFRACLLFLCLFVFNGCAPIKKFKPVPVEDAAGKGRLSFFLNLREIDGPALYMQISSIQLQSENGEIVTHLLAPLLAESEEIKGGQKFMARMAVEPGIYTQVRLLFDEAGIVGSKGRQAIPLLEEKAVMDLRTPLEIVAGDSKSMFFTWNTKQYSQESLFFHAVEVAPSLKNLIADVAYAACPEIDTVFMIDTDKNRVIDSLGIPGGPSYLLQKGDSRRDDVLVLAGKDLSMYAFSPSTNRMTERYSLTMLDDPVHAAISSDGKWAFVLDRRPGVLYRIDLDAGIIDSEVRLNFDPSYMIYMEQNNMLAVSLRAARSVALVHADSMMRAGSISTDGQPEGLRLVDGRYLYIAENGADSMLVYDMASNMPVKRLNVGFQPRRIFHTDNFLYVLHEGTGNVWAYPKGLVFNPTVAPFSGVPLEMAFNKIRGKVYIGNRDTMSIDVFHALTNHADGTIELGAVPQGILVLDEGNSF